MKNLISQIGSYKLLSCVFLGIVIDYSLYQQYWGWMLALVGALITFLIVVNNLNTFKSTYGKIFLGFNFLILLALVEDVSTLSISMLFLSLSFLGLIRNKIYLANFELLIRGVRRNIFTMFGKFSRDVFKIFKIKKGKSQFKFFQFIALSIVPIGLTLIFIFSFAKINPVMEILAKQLNIESLLALINFNRLLFWLIALSFTWSLLRNRVRLKQSKQKTGQYQNLFSYKSICISLIIFNLIFLTQGLSELSLLFDHNTSEISSALSSSAQDASYTLLFTAILACLYMLIVDTFRKIGDSTIFLKKLILSWTFQNVFLLCLAFRKLLIYIESYSLTYMRISALIWMYLVAVVLILCILKIAHDKSNSWVANIAILKLLLILTICCFINFPSLIAFYNVNHCREITGKGSNLDVYYLVSLGEEALPALVDYKMNGNAIPNFEVYSSLDYIPAVYSTRFRVRKFVALYHKFYLENDRAWSFRRFRLNSLLRKEHE